MNKFNSKKTSMYKKTSPLFKNIISLTIVQFITYLAPLLTLPYLSRILSIESFGLTMLIMSIIILSSLFTDFGFNLHAPAWIAKNKKRKQKISLYISSAFTIKVSLLILTSFAIAVYFYIANIPFENKMTLCIVTIFAILSQAFQMTWFFQGIEEMSNITKLTFLSKISYIIFVIISVKDQDDIISVIFCYALSNIITTVVGFFFYKRMGFNILKPPKSYIIQVTKSSFSFFLSRIAVSIYTSASTIIIGNFSGLTQAALYSSAEKLYQAGQSVSFPISQALYPYLARTKSIKTFYRFILILTPPLIIFISIIFNYSNEIIILFYGQEYSDATIILQLFLVTTVVNFISVNFGYPAFSIINRLDIANKSVIYASFMQISLLLYLYLNSNITAKSIAISILITEFFVMLIRIYNFIKLSRASINETK